MSARVVFTSRPWNDADGVASRPRRVFGVRVERELDSRRDAPGAVVALTDHRYALTGRVAAAGSRHQLGRFLRRRLRTADPREATWLRRAERVVATAGDEQGRGPVE